MRSIPQKQKVLDIQNPELWQLELLKLNPKVTAWTPNEGYMSGGTGMSMSVEFDNWEDFNEKWKLVDEYNHAVNFYFCVIKDREKCGRCTNGDHPELTLEANYCIDHNISLAITQNELEYYVKNGMLKSASNGRVYYDEGIGKFADHPNGEYNIDSVTYPPLDEVNAEINSTKIDKKWQGPLDLFTWNSILHTRRLLEGKPVKCEQCRGEGYIYFGDAKLRLALWFIHPKYGASRCVSINEITKEDLQQVFDYLKRTMEIITERFKAVTENVADKLDHIKSISGRWKDHRQQASTEGFVDT